MTAAILGIVTALLPMALKLITMYLTKSGAKIEAQKKWLDFMESLEESMTAPSKLRRSYAQQKARVDAIIKAIEEKEGVQE